MMVWCLLLIVISGLFWPAAIFLGVYTIAIFWMMIYRPKWIEWLEEHHFFG